MKLAIILDLVSSTHFLPQLIVVPCVCICVSVCASVFVGVHVFEQKLKGCHCEEMLPT